MEHNKVLPYEQQDADKKTQVTNMFDNIAPYYDFLNRFLSLGIDQSWRKKAIATLEDQKPRKILDMATGTADMAIQMAKTLTPESITGIDISPKMVDYGNKKLEKKGLNDVIKLSVGDSENLNQDSEIFDAATVAFGVRNFGNLQAGLKEMNRVLKIGGKIVVLEFSKPTIFPFKQLFNFYFKFILPTIGKFTSKDPKAYKYLYESVQAFPDYGDFGNILQECGFKDVSWKPLTLGICTIYTGIKG